MVPSDRYKALLIKDYEWWGLYLNEKQWPYLGRCYAWWKDQSPGQGEGMRPSHLSPIALLEIHETIFEDVREACKQLGHEVESYGKSFLLNVCYLANEPIHNHHMHWHFIPRFSKIITKGGLEFEDDRWGKMYSSEAQKVLPEPILESIRKTMAGAIGPP